MEKIVKSVKNGTPIYVKPYKEPKVWGIGGIGEYWYGSEKGDKSSIGVIGKNSVPLDKLVNAIPVELLGEKVFKKYGIFLPLVKVLTPAGRLSVQFHDAKNELWVVTGIHKEITGNKPDLIVGFSPIALKKHRGNILKEYLKALEVYGDRLNALISLMEEKGHRVTLSLSGNVISAAEKVKDEDPAIGELLGGLLSAGEKLDGFYHHVSVKVGDVIPVPKGTLHALGPGIEVVEPQIPGPTQSLEDGATYPVRYNFPAHPASTAKKSLDLDRVMEINTAEWKKGEIEVIYDKDQVSIGRMPGKFEDKGMQVNRISMNKGARLVFDGLKSYHIFVVVSGDAALEGLDEEKYSIPKAVPGGEMLLVPACIGGFEVIAGANTELLDIFTPIS
jgi:mannose-6-phosphate isomerase-like protein (cupin superfamily)